MNRSICFNSQLIPKATSTKDSDSNSLIQWYQNSQKFSRRLFSSKSAVAFARNNSEYPGFGRVKNGKKRERGNLLSKQSFQSKEAEHAKHPGSHPICIRHEVHRRERERMVVENAAESRITMIRRAPERAADVWQRCIKGMQIEGYKRGARYSRDQREHNADPEFSENSRANRRERHNRVYLMDGPFRPPWETVFQVFLKASTAMERARETKRDETRRREPEKNISGSWGKN